MLSKDDNEILCRVGPGTPMGNLLRQYWFPAMPSYELPSPDCPPKKLRLLGEDLVAFRDSTGAVGVLAQACPHRGASLFFGRNEESGLRCVYHGWKFDVTGQCVDMPSEPPESNFKAKIQATAYPAVEQGGLVWIYMGPKDKQPPLPPPGYRAAAGAPEREHVVLIPGTFRQTHNKDNDYLIDREVQRTVNFTGLPGNHVQDSCVTESMGPIYDRTREHLGTTDKTVIF